jgi:hypothetical protein
MCPELGANGGQIKKYAEARQWTLPKKIYPIMAVLITKH